MADNPLNIPIDAESIEKFRKELKALAETDLSAAVNRLKQYANALEAATRALDGIQKGTQAYKDQQAEIEKLRKTYQIAEDAVGGLIAAMATAEASAESATTQFQKMDTILGHMGMPNHPLIGTLKEVGQMIAGTGALALALGNDTLRGMIMPFSSADDIIKTLPRSFQNWNAVMRQSVEAVDLVNKAYLSYGRTLEDASRPASIFVDDVARISVQIGASKKDVLDFIKGFQGVPGALDAVGKSVLTAGGSMAQFGQLMLVAKAAGIDSANVAELMKTSYERFGQKGAEAAAANIATFHAAIAGTDIPMSKAMSQIQAASDPLAIFGRKMTETTNVWKTFVGALGDVPIDEVGKLVTAVSGQIANMSLNTQAFVAQMTGMAQGASALGGALRMELEMRQPGGMERNLERVTQAISRLGGGRIITLQEAAQTPALEMQFQLQRQMVGQMLGVQGGQQQSRVLEVLQGIEKGGITGVAADKEIQNLTQIGQKAQNASVTLLERIAQNTGRMTEVMKSMEAIEARPKAEMAAAGRAAGATSAGAVPRDADMRAMGLRFARAGEQLLTSVQPSMIRLFDTLSRRVGAFASGVGDLRASQARLARRTVAEGPPITGLRPSEQLLATPAPWAVGAPQMRGGTPRGAQPFFYRRPDPDTPTLQNAETPMAGQPARQGGVARRPVREGAGTAAAEYRAEPVVPETITVKVVCEQCSHQLGKRIERLSRENRGVD